VTGAERKPGFAYGYSAALGIEFAVSEKSGWVYCSDRGPDGRPVSYSPEEIALLAGRELTPEVHRVKKIFQGEVVGYAPRPREYKQGEMRLWGK